MGRFALVIDFDGTMTTEDVGLHVITEFGADGWDDGIKRFRAGEFNSRELHEWETGFLPSTKAGEMTEFAVERGELRPGLVELIDYARANDIPVQVASSGWGFYIRAIFERHGLQDLPYIAAEALFDDGEFATHGLSPGAAWCKTNSVCKCEAVRPHQSAGRTVIYIGDGLSDYCVAAQSDIVFARRALAQHCTEQKIPFTPFEDFFDVLEGLKALVEAKA